MLLSKVCLKLAREEVKFSVAKLARHTLASFEGEHAYKPRLTVKILLLLSLNLLGYSEQCVPRKWSSNSDCRGETPVGQFLFRRKRTFLVDEIKRAFLYYVRLIEVHCIPSLNVIGSLPLKVEYKKLPKALPWGRGWRVEISLTSLSNLFRDRTFAVKINEMNSLRSFSQSKAIFTILPLFLPFGSCTLEITKHR